MYIHILQRRGRSFLCLNSSSSVVIFLLGILHCPQNLSMQDVYLQMCMAVSDFKD